MGYSTRAEGGTERTKYLRIAIGPHRGKKHNNLNFSSFFLLDPRSCPQNRSIRHDEARTENHCPSLSKGNYSVFLSLSYFGLSIRGCTINRFKIKDLVSYVDLKCTFRARD